MTPIFIQTKNHIIDVSKVSHIKPTANGATIHFVGEAKGLALSAVDAEQLLDGVLHVSRSGAVIAHLAKGAA